MAKLIIGNWKMNPSDLLSAKKIFARVKSTVAKAKRTKVIMCVPYVYLYSLLGSGNGHIALGAQDAFWEEKGAFTGKISTRIIRAAGARYVILGHSEVRSLGDTDEVVNKKVRRALSERLMVVLCVGERVRDEEGKYLSFIGRQLDDALVKIPKPYFKNLIIAYEPVWAIGARAGGASTPEDFFEKSIFIRKVLSHIAGKDIAMKVSVLYGGSVDEKNAEGFLDVGRADGLLVGRASLDPDSFKKIILVANKF